MSTTQAALNQMRSGRSATAAVRGHGLPLPVSFAVSDRANRVRAALTMAAVPASTAETLRATVSECSAILNAIAAKVAPIVCPVRRAVASIPPAAPLRSSGAAESIERLFGAWKKPKPNPQSAIRQTRSIDDASTGRSARSPSPRQRTPRPAALKIAGEMLSAKRPASGAPTPTASGHGVINKPVSIWVRCKIVSKKNGNETNASI